MGQKTFSISVKSVNEISPNGNMVRSVFVPNLKFALNESHEGLNTIRNYSCELTTGATLSVVTYQFGEPATKVDFAGTTTTYTANTLKIAVYVQNWPFFSLANSLHIVMDTDNKEKSTCYNEKRNEGGSVQWVMIVIDDVALYGQFINKAEIDNRVRTISFKSANNSISAILPHFWNYAYMDPQFSLLLGDKNIHTCEGQIKNNKMNTITVVAISVPVVVGTCLIVGAVVVFLYRVQTKFSIKKGKKRARAASAPSELPLGGPARV